MILTHSLYVRHEYPDAIGAVLANKFLVFQLPQVWVGPYIADTLVAWIETFQGFVADSLANAGSVGAGFVPGLITVVTFAAALVYLCVKAEKDLKREYALSRAKVQ